MIQLTSVNFNDIQLTSMTFNLLQINTVPPTNSTDSINSIDPFDLINFNYLQPIQVSFNWINQYINSIFIWFN